MQVALFEERSGVVLVEGCSATHELFLQVSSLLVLWWWNLSSTSIDCGRDGRMESSQSGPMRLDASFVGLIW